MVEWGGLYHRQIIDWHHETSMKGVHWVTDPLPEYITALNPKVLMMS